MYIYLNSNAASLFVSTIFGRETWPGLSLGLLGSSLPELLFSSCGCSSVKPESFRSIVVGGITMLCSDGLVRRFSSCMACLHSQSLWFLWMCLYRLSYIVYGDYWQPLIQHLTAKLSSLLCIKFKWRKSCFKRTALKMQNIHFHIASLLFIF